MKTSPGWGSSWVPLASEAGDDVSCSMNLHVQSMERASFQLSELRTSPSSLSLIRACSPVTKASKASRPLTGLGTSRGSGIGTFLLAYVTQMSCFEIILLVAELKGYRYVHLTFLRHHHFDLCSQLNRLNKGLVSSKMQC